MMVQTHYGCAKRERDQEIREVRPTRAASARDPRPAQDLLTASGLHCRPNFLHQFWKNKQFTGTRTRLSPGLDAMKIDFQAFAG